MSIENSDLLIDTQTDSICFTFPSTMDHIDIVIMEAIEYLYMRVEDVKKHVFAINLVLREGLTNAVRHGNQNDPEKNIKLSLDVGEKPLIKVSIEDQGDGFDWKNQQGSDLPEFEDHGRGMIIIGSYFTSYSYNEKGNVLFLTKDISE